jgi:hypothetical protein
MEDLRLKLLLPYTDAVNKVINERREKEKRYGAISTLLSYDQQKVDLAKL